MTIDGVTLDDGKYGLRAVIAAAWCDEMTTFLVDNRIAELELNEGKGWQGNDLEFLTELPQLQSLKIIDFKTASVEPIHFLHQLRALEVMTYCTSEIRFSEFPRLEDCGLEWRPRATSLFDRTTLKSLFINNYDGKNTDEFARLINLESLALLNAPIDDLRSLSALVKLRSLRLADLKRLTSLAGIERLTNLEELEIHTCRRIGSIDEIGYLHRLRRLYLNNDGNIESFKPLCKLTELESILFYESTNIVDGDLSPLLNQRKLSRVSFQNRSHYTHRREEFGLALERMIMAESNQLIVPDAARQDPTSFEVVRVWMANKGLHVTLRTAVWEDPFAYGVMLCDLMKHIANAYHQNEGRDWHEAFERIKAGLDAELASPTDRPTGH